MSGKVSNFAKKPLSREAAALQLLIKGCWQFSNIDPFKWGEFLEAWDTVQSIPPENFSVFLLEAANGDQCTQDTLSSIKGEILSQIGQSDKANSSISGFSAEFFEYLKSNYTKAAGKALIHELYTTKDPDLRARLFVQFHSYSGAVSLRQRTVSVVRLKESVGIENSQAAQETDRLLGLQPPAPASPSQTLLTGHNGSATTDPRYLAAAERVQTRAAGVIGQPLQTPLPPTSGALRAPTATAARKSGTHPAVQSEKLTPGGQ